MKAQSTVFCAADVLRIMDESQTPDNVPIDGNAYKIFFIFHLALHVAGVDDLLAQCTAN